MGSFSIWHWLVVLIAFGIPGTVIYLAVRSTRAEGTVMTPGIKGWLYILAVTLWIGVLSYSAFLIQALANNDPAVSEFPALYWIDVVVAAVGFTVSLVAVIMMHRRSRAFVGAYLTSAAVAVMSFPITVVCTVAILNHIYSVPITAGRLLEAMPSEIGRWAGALVGVGLWVAYVLRSRRVQMTFVR